MRQDGIYVRCDRCGQNKFYGSDETLALKKIAEDGWRVRNNKDLCEKCAAEYDTMVYKFFNEVWDK